MSLRFGERFVVELFGSSHGPEVGARVSGVPVGTPLDLPRIQAMLDRRRPLGRSLASRRRERDALALDEGYAEGRVVGPVLRAHVANEDVRRTDYAEFAHRPRPGHADYPARVRFGEEADLSGGGMFSGRMTVGLVFAGAVAEQLLAPLAIELMGYPSTIGPVAASVSEEEPVSRLRIAAAQNEVGCPDAASARAMEAAIAEARRDGDSVGGIIELRADGLPVGLGEPFFDPIESLLAHLALAVPAVKGIEFGAGFAAGRMRGSAHNDPFYFDGQRVRTRTNHAGGALGGLTTGMPLRFRVVVKPTSSIARPQETVDLRTHASTTIRVGGRHDPCIVPRAVVVVEAITWIVLAELALRGGFLP